MNDCQKNPIFDYEKEPSRDILCIDCKSFYASVECVERGLNPLKTKLVVMSYPSDNPKERGSGLILASSPMAKKAYGISNVSRARDLPYPYPDDLIIAPPRMRLYMEKNQEINAIYKQFADDNNHHVYSVDESFLDMTEGMKMYHVSSAFEMARLIQREVYIKTGIYTAVGIGDNPLLAKLALDNESKYYRHMKAEWRYQDVPNKIWKISDLTDFWGIGKRTTRRLQALNIYNLYDLAHADYYLLKEALGVIGTQLYAHAWGIDRTFLGQVYHPLSKSIGNSQVLPRNYHDPKELEIVITEMADQVGTRLRRLGAKSQVICLTIGFSLGYLSDDGKTGFRKQLKIRPTNTSGELARYLLGIFRQFYRCEHVRTVAIQASDLIYTHALQLNLFEEPESQIKRVQVDDVVDAIRKKHGFRALIHANSLLEGGRAIARSSLVGGHAGGMGGLE
ncbi:Y-family DNA polymerase [Vagococcus xieshaowenii]|uniref:Y-family DNA polymerase n=1 Tax=Vagococcus xieshaowenii TaxID=2562451 RepID=A0AAJ5JMS4_9ENTE|nr:Y-family DNA polymerase [Vagococcus xieshaowenii]QCA28794.1 Y-family DNA polymerase [Vagococcus xieshaowenii]TFZ43005.1 Y-family DNA polymerase [Vagococcus xieshaowenii]